MTYTDHLDLQIRFWSKVDLRGSDDCWLWVGALNPKGYGYLCLNGKTTPSRRVAWALIYGSLPPKGIVVRHKGGSRSCCNPAHLFAASKQNMMRRVGQSEVSANKQVTHCPQGHEYTPENTYIYTSPKGQDSRSCRTCRGTWRLRHYYWGETGGVPPARDPVKERGFDTLCRSLDIPIREDFPTEEAYRQARQLDQSK